MSVVNLVEPYQCREQANVGLCQFTADQVAGFAEEFFRLHCDTDEHCNNGSEQSIDFKELVT